jgi:hypothetical protein
MSTTIRAVDEGEHNHQVDVIGVDERGVSILVGGRKDAIGWHALEAACRQEDPGLADLHKRIDAAATEWTSLDTERRLHAALQAVRDGALVEYWAEHDETNVWWVSHVVACGVDLVWSFRTRDEGGTHPSWACAIAEARAIAERIKERHPAARIVHRQF